MVNVTKIADKRWRSVPEKSQELTVAQIEQVKKQVWYLHFPKRGLGGTCQFA